MSPSTSSTMPNIPYFLGNTTRRTVQKTPKGDRVVESPTHALQGKVVSLAPRIKTNHRGSNYFVVRVAIGELGFAMATAYDQLAQEFAALSVGDIVTMDGRWRRERKFDPQVGSEVITNWFTARSYNVVLDAPAALPADSSFQDPPEYVEEEHF